MKINLAENLLRFAPKNLDIETIEKLQQLAEQQATATPTAATTYQSNPLYDVFYKKLDDNAKRYWDGKKVHTLTKQKMDDVGRQQVFDVFLQKFNEHAAKNKLDQNKNARQIDYIAINSQKGEETTKTTAGTVTPAETPPAPIVATAVYPNNQEVNPQLSNFFLRDNVVVVSEQNKQAFTEMVDGLVKQVKAAGNVTITKIEVYAGSSTSQVPTKFEGGNPGLAKARYNAILTTLNDIIKTQVPEYTGQVTILPGSETEIKPDQGPAWTPNDKVAFPYIKRQQFLENGQRNPDFDPKILAAYEKKYGQYKGSYGGVTITAQRVKTTPTEPESTPPETETVVKSGWRTVVRWKARLSDLDIDLDFRTPKLFRKNYKGGGQSFIGVGLNTLKCTVW